MAKRNKLLELEQKHGSLERVIPPLVNQGGQKLAAEKLGTSQNTISRWLSDHGYVNRPYWTKATTPQERADIDAAAAQVNARRIAQGLPTLEEEADLDPA